MTGSVRVPIVVTVRANASPQIGYGHVYRTLRIAQCLQTLGSIRVRYLMDPSSDCGAVESAGMEVMRARSGIVDSIMIDTQPDDGPVILDSYSVTADDLQRLRGAGYTTATIDDGKRLESYATDVLIDAAPDAQSLGYCTLQSTILCLGAHYFPLWGPSHRRKAPGHPGVVGRVLITFGGSDPDDQTSRVLSRVLAKHEHTWKVTAVLGPGYEGTAEEIALDLPFVTILRSVERMSEVFVDADLAMAGGGSTSFELAYHGIPTVVMELSADQHAVATGFHKAGASVNVGQYAEVEDSAIWEALESLAGAPMRLRAMSGAGRTMVDGQGAQRIVEALLTAWNRRRSMSPDPTGCVKQVNHAD